MELSYPGDRTQHCEMIPARRRHDSEQSSCSAMESNDLEAAEALVCMSSWGQGSPRPGTFRPRPLTPASDSCDSLLQPDHPDTPKEYVCLSSLCMTPPHSPSFAENMTSATVISPPSSTIPPASSISCCSWAQQQAAGHPSKGTSLKKGTSAPCRAMATSVIRHTADRSPCQHIPPAAIQQQPAKAEQQKQQHMPTPAHMPAAAPCQSVSKGCMAAPPSGKSLPVLVPQSPPPNPSPPIICQMFPVASQTGVISAFIQSPPQRPSPGVKSILPQPYIVGTPVPQGAVMFVVPQSPVPQAAQCAQTLMTLGNTKLLPLAPAPVYMPSGPSSASQMDLSRRRNYVCNFPGCRKTYFKSSHLKAHLRTHTGEKPFSCNWDGCDKKFARSDELSRHRRTHTGEKKFVCPVCDRRFMRSDHLTKHARRHMTTKKVPSWQAEVRNLNRMATAGATPSGPAVPFSMLIPASS